MRCSTALAAVLAAFATGAVAAGAPSDADIVGVASVIDGDTIDVHGTRIRFFGVDAPESHQLCMREGKPYPCGRAVANLLSDHIGRQTVRCESHGKDPYGRTIAACYVGDECLNRWLVKNGLALAYRHFSMEYAGDEDIAHSRGVGIWGMQFQAPWDYRRAKRAAVR